MSGRAMVSALLLAGVVGAAACSSSVPSPRCVVTDALVLRGISQGLTVTGGGWLRFGQAVRSDDFHRAYFVAADIQGPGLNGPDEIGVWVTNRIDGSAGFASVDGYALEFSDWGDGGRTDAAFSMTNDGAQEAKDCADALG